MGEGRFLRYAAASCFALVYGVSPASAPDASDDMILDHGSVFPSDLAASTCVDAAAIAAVGLLLLAGKVVILPTTLFLAANSASRSSNQAFQYSTTYVMST